MKTYYCVMSEFYDNGAVKAAIISRAIQGMDAYADWFEDKAEAERFLAETKAA